MNEIWYFFITVSHIIHSEHEIKSLCIWNLKPYKPWLRKRLRCIGRILRSVIMRTFSLDPGIFYFKLPTVARKLLGWRLKILACLIQDNNGSLKVIIFLPKLIGLYYIVIIFKYLSHCWARVCTNTLTFATDINTSHRSCMGVYF